MEVGLKEAETPGLGRLAADAAGPPSPLSEGFLGHGGGRDDLATGTAANATTKSKATSRARTQAKSGAAS